jgi:hypothetical protein
VAACTARGTWAACGGFGFARNATTTTFDVFYWLQVTNFNVFLKSAPNGADYIDIRRLLLHGRFRIADSTQYSQRFFDPLPLLDIAFVLVRLDRVARFILNGSSLRTHMAGDGKRFVLRADEKLTAFLELESVIRACGELF